MRRIWRAVPILILSALVFAPPGTPQARADRAKAKAFVDAIWSKLEFVPLMVNGDKDNRINIVIINRWTAREPKPYNNPSMRAEFFEDARSVVRAFTPGDPKAVTPVAEYSKFFNIYAIWWPDQPIWDPGTPDGLKEPVFQEIRDRYFLPWKNEETGWVTLMAMLNTDGGGGGAARDVIARTGDAYIAGCGIEGFIHEFGHTATRVSDEYTSIGTWGFGAESNNTTNETRRDKIKWRAWIDPATPIPTPYAKEYLGKVGLFEGGQSRLSDHFRPTAQGCLMGAGIFGVEYLCPVCVQHFIWRFYQLVDPMERISPAAPKAAIAGATKVRFAVERLRPSPDTQKAEWILNGKTIASGADAIDVDFGPLPEYELVFRLTDPTAMIRPDPPYVDFPKKEIRWSISNAKPESAASPLSIELKVDPPTCSGADDGAVAASVTGGVPPYDYLWSDGRTGAALRGLGEGLQEVTVIDREFRRARASGVLKREALLSVDIRTSRENGAWRAALNARGRGPLAYAWSTGASSDAVEGLGDGRYSWTVKDVHGCLLRGEIELVAPAAPLRLKAEATPSTAGQTNGRIRIDAAGGRPPYSFLWSETEIRGGRGVGYPAAEAKHSSPIPEVGRDQNIKDGNLSCLKLQAGGGWIEWTVRVLRAGDYPLDIVYLAQAEAVLSLEVNGRLVEPAVKFPKTPEWREWKTRTVVAALQAGDNTIRLTSPSAPGIDVDTLIVPETAQVFPLTDRDRQGLAPGVYKLRAKDANATAVEATIRVGSEPGFLLRGENVEKSGPRTLRVARPRPDFRYLWYADDASPRLPEALLRPLAMGREFSPARPGNYFLAARKLDSGAESSNRIGFAVTMSAEAGSRPVPPPEPRRPDAAGAKLLMWLDASDTDGDGNEDVWPPKRGVLLGWKSKADGAHFGDTNMVFFQPNLQNGRGIASWETIWLQRLAKPVTGWRTVVMAFREHSLSRPGTAPFSGLSPYLGRGEEEGRIFSEKVLPETKAAAVYLDGRKVDPLATPAPEGFRVLTVIFEKPIDKPFDRTDTHWSGAVGEIIVYDGPLTDVERAGIEEYLRRKWISSFDLERPAGRPSSPSSRTKLPGSGNDISH